MAGEKLEFSDYVETREAAASLTGGELLILSQGSQSKSLLLNLLKAFLGAVVIWKSVDQTAGIDLDCDDAIIGLFETNASVTADKNVTVTDAVSTKELKLIWRVTNASGLFWPTGFVSEDPRWEPTTRKFSPIDVNDAGVFIANGNKLGTNWYLTFTKLSA